GERREVRRAMAGDVDEPALAGQPAPGVVTRPFLQLALPRALDDDHVEPDPPDGQTADGVARPERAAIRGCLGRHGPADRREIPAAAEVRSVPACAAVVVVCEPRLLEVRVDG